MTRLPCLLAAALMALAGCAGPGASAPAPPQPPRLVVLVVVDGLPQRQLEDHHAQFGRDGLRRFLDRGAWFTQAHYGHANTLTGPGHATMLTGAYPHRTGIIANEWRDPESLVVRYCAGDASARYIGHATRPLDGTSPRNLLVETVGDVLKRASTASKVIAVSGKDRGAILPAGHAGTAYMYQEQTGAFASTTHYMREHPPWVDAFNAARPADRYFGREWRPLRADAEYAPSIPDGQPWYGPGGRLPRTMGEGLERPGPLFYGALLATPFGDALTLEFASAAVRGERLGADDAPDILSVSLSAHDYINHAYGPESRISHDHLLHVDRLLEAFFAGLDREVGAGNYLAVLTADHGFMPVPEFLASRGHDAGRANASQLVAKVDAGLAARFGEGPWVAALSAQGLLLDRRRIAARQADALAIAEEARRLLLAEPYVEAVFTRHELGSGPRPGDARFEQVRKSFHPARSPDLAIVLRPYWIFGSSSRGPTGTTHGSPHAYDTHVPIAFHGAAWVRPGRVDAPAEVVDIAPTLASILRIATPAAAEGRPLALAP